MKIKIITWRLRHCVALSPILLSRMMVFSNVLDGYHFVWASKSKFKVTRDSKDLENLHSQKTFHFFSWLEANLVNLWEIEKILWVKYSFQLANYCEISSIEARMRLKLGSNQARIINPGPLERSVSHFGVHDQWLVVTVRQQHVSHFLSMLHLPSFCMPFSIR